MDNQNFFEMIQTNYGTPTRDHFRTIQRLNEKLASNIAREVFLLKCRRYEIFPGFIRNKTSNILSAYKTVFASEVKSIELQLQNKILDFEIGMCNRSRREILLKIATRKMCLSNCPEEAKIFIDTCDLTFEECLARKNNALYSKFKTLLQSQDHVSDVKYDESFVRNISGVEIPYEMLVLLSLGPKFALEPDHLPIPDLVRDLEYIVACYSHPSISNTVRGQLAYTLTKHNERPTRPNRIQSFLKKAVKTTSKFLKDHPNIFISTSDKGNTTVVCDRLDYERKMSELLRDTNQFQPLSKDPTTSCATTLNNMIKIIRDKNSISRKEQLHLQSTTAIPPRIFGQYKVHKTKPDGSGHPLRLITSTVKTVSYNTSKKLTAILTAAYSQPKYTIKNSRGALNAIKNKRFLRGYRMASFDMENCFGSISTTLAIELVENDFDTKIRQHTTLEKDDFIALLRICLDECNYLLYKGQFYRQLNGIFMGNSLGSILVQIVTEHIIDNVIKQLKRDKLIPPTVWIVYVDDHLVICREEHINIILQHLNAFDPGRIKFTCEIEEDAAINFLDLTLIRQSGKIITNWYTKPIASNRILNYCSTHPKNMITNVAKSMVKKVIEYSDEQFHQQNLEKVRKILLKNNFPPTEICKIIRLATTTHPNENNRTTSSPPGPPRYCSVTYVPKISETLRHQIKYFIPEVVIANKPDNKLGKFYSKNKDKLDPMENSDVVYQVDCQICSSRYLGETTQKCCMRKQQHRNSCSQSNLNKPKLASALAYHTKTTGHQFNFDSMKIIDRNSNKKKLQISEVNHIIMNGDRACNFKKDTAQTAPVYSTILKRYAENHKWRTNPSTTNHRTLVS